MIDWTKIAVEAGAIQEGQESGSSTLAKVALEKLIGEQNLREAVDHYIDLRPGFELTRSILSEIRPWSAMAYCYELYQSSEDIDIRRSAIELLRVIADKRVLPWVKEFLDDPDEGIQAWGFGVLDQLLWREFVQPEDAEPLLIIAEHHPNQRMHEHARFVRDYLARREHQCD
jgi:HEAT repeat protein